MIHTQWRGNIQQTRPEEHVALPGVEGRRLCCSSSERQQDGLRSVLEKCCSVLGLAFLDPVAVKLEGTAVNELAYGLDGVRVTLDHLLGDGLGTAVIAVDSHCGKHSYANDLLERVQ